MTSSFYENLTTFGDSFLDKRGAKGAYTFWDQTGVNCSGERTVGVRKPQRAH